MPPRGPVLPNHQQHGRKQPRPSHSFAVSDVLLVLATLWAVGYLLFMLAPRNRPKVPEYLMDPVLISYAYYEKDPIQVANFEYFLAVGSHYPLLHSNMHWVFVVSGDKCTPCTGLYNMLDERDATDLTALGIKDASFSTKFSLLVRSENIGMDLAAHNVTLEWLSYRAVLGRYKYFIFLNSSVKGPFLPAWTPPEWHWTAAYLAAFQPPVTTLEGGPGSARSGNSHASLMASFVGQPGMGGPPVHAVSSSLVCLPADDAAGPGPRLESWAFALDQEGLAVAIEAGVFIIRGCKLCKDADSGVVVGGEYGITASMFAAGFNIATLMSKYAKGIDWSDPQHWSCNDNVHPSRAGTYEGISLHPFETVFVKSSWHVAEPYTRRYSQWQLQQLLGKAGTEGSYNPKKYKFAISKGAEHPKDLEAAYNALAAV